MCRLRLRLSEVSQQDLTDAKEWRSQIHNEYPFSPFTRPLWDSWKLSDDRWEGYAFLDNVVWHDCTRPVGDSLHLIRIHSLYKTTSEPVESQKPWAAEGP